MTGRPPVWLAWVWAVAGGLGVLGGLAFAAVGWSIVTTVSGSAVAASGQAADALESVTRLTSSLDETFGEVTDALRDVQVTVSNGSVSITQLAAATGDLAEVVSGDVPRAVDGVVDAMPSLVATAGIVDGAMRTLSLVGVDYDPDEPLDDTLRRIEAELTGIPPRLRAQSERLEAAVDGLAGFSSAALAVSEDLAGIRAALLEAERLAATVESSSQAGATLARELVDRIPGQAAWLGTVVVVLGLFVAGAATLPLHVGRRALMEPDGPEASPAGHPPDGSLTPGPT